MNNIRALRLSRGLTQRELADVFGITEVAFSAWEVGTNEMSASALIEMAEFFGVSVDYLIGRNTTPFRPVSQRAEIYQFGEVFSGEDLDIIARYRALDADGKDFARAILTHEVQRVRRINEAAGRFDALQK